MSFLITRPADVVGAVLLLVGCSQGIAAPLSGRSQVGGASGSHDAVAGGPRLVRITDFDCEKPLAFPDPNARKGPIVPGAGIRGWRGGGPMGANWNVYDLRCVIRANTTCTKGKASLILRVGQHVVAERDAELSGATLEFDLTVEEKVWERGIDETGKGALRRQPFKTANFRAAVAVDCQAPTKASLRDSNYSDVVAEDGFTSGFASGE
jgi:hypothetical protein